MFEYAGFRGSFDGMDPTAITEIARYFEDEIGYVIPPRTPFVGEDFNMTKAGIHADGLLKDQEIYTIFNTEKLLNKKPGVTVGKTSGLAGIAYWINEHFELPMEKQVDKKDPLVLELKEWIDELYENGRNTNISNREMRMKIKELRK